MTRLISGHSLCRDIRRIIKNDKLTDRERLVRIENATTLYREMNDHLLTSREEGMKGE